MFLWFVVSKMATGADSSCFVQSSKKNRKQDMSHLMEKPTMWFPNRFDTNRPVQLQKLARSLKFWI